MKTSLFFRLARSMYLGGISTETKFFLPFLSMLCISCTQTFPRPVDFASQITPAGNVIFEKTFKAHGGENLSELKNLNVSIDGNWRYLITKLQPIITDHRYRIKSEERIIPGQSAYSAFYTGPDGNKKVVRTPDSIEVFYNGLLTNDQDTLSASALTSDSYLLFLLGPLHLKPNLDFIRLKDGHENNQSFYRIYARIHPGIGLSDEDEIILWIDKDNFLTYRVEETLNGFRTTQGAHVDVTYLDYINIDGFVFPSKFHERVLSPIKLNVHTWFYTGIDINRSYSFGDLNEYHWRGEAKIPAYPHAELN